MNNDIEKVLRGAAQAAADMKEAGVSEGLEDYQLLVQLLGELAERREKAAPMAPPAPVPPTPRPAAALSPTVGRLVHFTGSDGSGPYPALVVQIDDHPESPIPPSVRLCTFGPSSIYFQSAPLAPASAPTAGCWHWPPLTTPFPK